MPELSMFCKYMFLGTLACAHTNQALPSIAATASTVSTLCVDSASWKDYCGDCTRDCLKEALLRRTAVENCSRLHARTFNILQMHVSRHNGMCAHKPSVAIYRGQAAGVDTPQQLTQNASACGKERSRKATSMCLICKVLLC